MNIFFGIVLVRSKQIKIHYMFTITLLPIVNTDDNNILCYLLLLLLCLPTKQHMDIWTYDANDGGLSQFS